MSEPSGGVATRLRRSLHSTRGQEPDLLSTFFVDFFVFAHLAMAALRALALRCSGVSFAAPVLPPFEPPSFPSATASDFFRVFNAICSQLLEKSIEKHLIVRRRLRTYSVGALKEKMKKADRTLRANLRLARSTWGPLSRTAREGLAELLKKFAFSVALGDIQYLDQRWYVRLGSRCQCSDIRVSPVSGLCEPRSGRWVLKATVFSSSNSRG
jgi:hypothetical protein